MDNAWSITLTEHDDIVLRSGSFSSDLTFRVFLRSNLEGYEQTFTFMVPAQEVSGWSSAQKTDLFNRAIDVVETFVGTDLEANEQTHFVLEGGRFISGNKPDWFTRHLRSLDVSQV